MQVEESEYERHAIFDAEVGSTKDSANVFLKSAAKELPALIARPPLDTKRYSTPETTYKSADGIEYTEIIDRCFELGADESLIVNLVTIAIEASTANDSLRNNSYIIFSQYELCSLLRNKIGSTATRIELFEKFWAGIDLEHYTYEEGADTLSIAINNIDEPNFIRKWFNRTGAYAITFACEDYPMGMSFSKLCERASELVSIDELNDMVDKQLPPVFRSLHQHPGWWIKAENLNQAKDSCIEIYAKLHEWEEAQIIEDSNQMLIDNIKKGREERSRGFAIKPSRGQNANEARISSAIKQADVSFRAKDYDRVVQVLDPIEDQLPNAWLRKLSFAQKKTNQ